jgi:catechol 2,3-dioxygenase-like lactoylglutathione lyase family enzyme
MSEPLVDSLDHLVITVHDEAATRRFYADGLGMRWITFGQGRTALRFGSQKINIHHHGREFEPKAAVPTPGSQDLCFLSPAPLSNIARRMEALGFPAIEGPVARSGATSAIRSLYFRDPDGNLIEIANRTADQE